LLTDINDGHLVGVESCNKYSNDIIIRFLNAFKEILIQMVDKIDLSDINYTSVSDLALLDVYNETEHILDYKDILDAFNDNLSKNQDDDLVSFGDMTYSYGEGAYIADKIAKSLIELNVKSQDCVAFLTQRCEHYMFAVLAVMSVGAVYVPLDDAHPDSHLEFIIKDTKSKVIIVSDETYERAKYLINEDVVLLNISEIVNDELESLEYLPV
ncbi:AMP-binding protein, partial [Methanobrevibacter sp.]